MDERDIAKKPIRSAGARYGMGYDYYDWICPSCKHFLTFEPDWQNIPKRCQECGQLLEKLTREEAEGERNGTAVRYRLVLGHHFPVRMEIDF